MTEKRRARPFLHRKTKNRSEAQSAQDAQRVLGKTRIRFAHAADETLLQVGSAAEGVLERQPARPSR